MRGKPNKRKERKKRKGQPHTYNDMIFPSYGNGIPSEIYPIAVRGAPNNRKDAPNKREDPRVYDFLTPLAQNAREPNKRKEMKGRPLLLSGELE